MHPFAVVSFSLNSIFTLSLKHTLLKCCFNFASWIMWADDSLVTNALCVKIKHIIYEVCYSFSWGSLTSPGKAREWSRRHWWNSKLASCFIRRLHWMNTQGNIVSAKSCFGDRKRGRWKINEVNCEYIRLQWQDTPSLHTLFEILDHWQLLRGSLLCNYN